MPKFGARSKLRLSTCHPKIQDVMNAVIPHIDFTIIYGYRNEADQTAAFEAGNSQVEYPNSTHNTDPSLGIDIAPWPIDWNDTNQFRFLAGIILATAWSMGITLRWGGCWKSDWKLKANRFNDLGHFEVLLDKSPKI